jgi:hypothetical protein
MKHGQPPHHRFDKMISLGLLLLGVSALLTAGRILALY